MGLRYTATQVGNVFTHVVNIYETTYTGATVTGVLADDFIDIRYTGDGENMHEPIRASECVISVFVQHGSATATFVDLLNSYQEKQFYIEVLRCEVGGTPAIFWRGVILQDNFMQENQLDYVYQITAICGLSRLKELTSPPPDTNTNLIERIIYMLRETGIDSRFGTSDVFLATNMRYFEINHASLARDPLAVTNYNNAGVHWEYTDEAVGEPRTYYDVLDAICRAFNLRLLQSNGHFWLIQPNNHSANSLTLHKYSNRYDMGTNPLTPTTAALSSNVSEAAFANADNDNDLDFTNAVVEFGGVFMANPALKKVLLTYDFKGNRSVYNSAQVDLSALTSTLYTVGTGSGKLFITGTMYSVYNVTLTGTQQVQFDYYYVIKCGSQYWNGSAWVGSIAIGFINSGYYWATSGVQLQEQHSFQISTAQAPAGLIEVQFYGTPHPMTGITFTKVTQLTDLKILLANTMYQEGSQLYTATNNNTNVDSSIVYDFGSTFIGDNTEGAHNKLYYWNGSAWVATTLWGRETLSGSVALLQLTTQMVLATQVDPVQVLDATFWGANYMPHKVWRWTLGAVTRRLVFSGGTYSARTESWNGTWVVLAENTSKATINAKIKKGIINAILDNSIINANQVIGFGKVASTGGVASGTITSLAIAAPGHSDILAGDIITIMNPVNGASEELTVTANVASGATSISVSSITLANAYPVGCWVAATGATLQKKATAVANSIPVQIAARLLSPFEEDADFTLTSDYANAIVRCYDACATITLDTPVAGMRCRLYNDAGGNIEISTPAVGVGVFADGEIVELTGVPGVGWVAVII